MDELYFDPQINGCMGIDFSSADLTTDDCARAFRTLIGRGIDMFLPTIITNSAQTYESNLRILASLASQPEFRDHVPGLHAEGPFISPEPGGVGAHNPEWVRPGTVDFFQHMQDWALGQIRLLTIAAENPGAEELTKYAVKRGTVVSLGHQVATADDMQRLADVGATCLTHLGNGMPNVIGRHENQILAGMAVDELTAMIIVDGHHLPAHVIKAIIRAKGVEKVIATSDASPIAGMPPGQYNVSGNRAILEESGLLHNPEKGCLVGSSALTPACVQYLRSLNILSEADIRLVTRENALRLFA